MRERSADKADGMFRTRDLPLAAYLALHDVTHVRMERQGKSGYWVFRRDPTLEHLVAECEKGEVTIDIRAFMDCVSKVRSDLYTYLGIN